MRQTLKR